MSGGKSSKQKVGYKYYMDLHFGICHGPVDYLSEIRVGGRTAYNVTVTDSGEIYINEPSLFGGEKREGGIQGYADILSGGPTQIVNDYLQEKIGAAARVPAYRGLYSLLYKGGLVSANNPYIKPWAFKVGRIQSGWGGQQETASTEYDNYVLYPWDVGADPRNCKNDHEYRAGTSIGITAPTVNPWTDLTTAVANFQAHNGWSRSTARVRGWTKTSVSDSTYPYDNISTEETEIVSLYFSATYDEDEQHASIAGVNPCAAFSSATSNGTVSFWWGGRYDGNSLRQEPTGVHQAYLDPENNPSSPDFGPGLLPGYNPVTGCFGGANGWNGSGSDSWGVYGAMDMIIECRRKIRAPDEPCLPRCEDTPPDYPPDSNYCVIDDVAVKRGPWVLTGGGYKVLAIYRVSGTEVVQYPLGPVLPVGHASYDDADFWASARNAAILAGYEVPSTYSSNGLGGVSTYPRYVDDAFNRDGGSIVEGDPWEPELAQIDSDMNPAHIVYQCITNAEWGMGYPAALIGDSFLTAAQTLYTEGFGLSFQWTRQEPVEDFIGQVLNHCGGVWYADPRTGKFEMALIRDDYDLSDLPTFDESNILAVESYQKPGYGELVNEITVVWTDVPNNKAATTAPLQDPACIQAQGAVISEVRQYPGITKAALAQRVALRDLTAASTPLASIKLKVNREGWDLIPGKDCIILSWQKLGITQLVCRVLKVDRGTLEDGAVTLEVAEDVFGLPDAVYTTQESEEWTDPEVVPDDITALALVESPYWDLARNLSAADLDYTDVDAGYVFTLAGRSSDVETSYGIWSRTGTSDYEDRGTGPYSATALLNGAIDQQDTTINLDNGVDLDDVEVGDRVLIGSGRLAEFCEVLSLDTTTGVMTVNRAVLDTTPQEHDDNTRVWFVEDSFGIDQTERATSDEVDVKLTAIATGGESDLADATEQTITLAGRFGRPYPPGRILINGYDFPETVDTTEDASEGFVITWAHRDRIQQTASLVTQNDSDIGPETGTTYTVELYDDDTDELVDTTSGITGTSLSITATDSFDARLEIYSVRDGIESWQRQVRRFALLGTDVFVTEDGDYFITEDGQILAPE